MRNKLLSLLTLILCMLTVLLCSIAPVSALDTKYYIPSLELSLKIPKDYTVITRETPRGDKAFSTLSLDYDETMTAFSAADIYLQATSEDKLLKVTLTMIKDDNSLNINNYSDLTAAQRQSVLDAFLADDTYTSGVEVKHNDSIYFDLNLTKANTDKTLYGYQCNTVVNGMNINLSIQKDNEELTTDEIKVVTNIANSIEFDDIKRKSGPSFEWWRILLWIFIMAVITVATLMLFKRYEKNKKEQLELRRERRRASRSTDVLLSEIGNLDDNDGKLETNKRSLLSEMGFDSGDFYELGDYESFESTLGYDTTDYKERVATDLDSIDISVKQKSMSSGVSYFEDSGQSINDKPDYFDRYFSEDVQKRSALRKFFSAVYMYIRIALRHTGFFFVNLYRMIFKPKKSK